MPAAAGMFCGLSFRLAQGHPDVSFPSSPDNAGRGKEVPGDEDQEVPERFLRCFPWPRGGGDTVAEVGS